MLQITCHTFGKLPLEQITEFQGDLKKRTIKDIQKIIESLQKNGFAFPFFVWKNGDTNFCLDGHGRLKALKKMQVSGEEIPALPVVYVDADDVRDAKIKLLQASSQYGRIDPDILSDFAIDIDLEQFSLPDLGKESFIFETPATEHREVIQLFGRKIACSAEERKIVEQFLNDYILEHGAYLGVVARLFGKDNTVEYGEFVEKVSIDTLTGAHYNPREIDKKKVETLAESIRFCGFCRPVIVNRRNSIIIAGDQRTKAARLLGLTDVPVYFTYAGERGEMVINQIHNALEDNTGDRLIRVPSSEQTGYRNISAKNIAYTGKQTNFSYSFGIQLLTYGNIDAGVATWDAIESKEIDRWNTCG
jgi:ParB-like chromosome segregation protein Spo0J